MIRRITFVGLLALLGCSEEDPADLAVDTALCARLQNGPATAFMASTSTTTAPSVGAGAGGIRIDVSLPAERSGSLAFDISEGARFAVGLNQDIELVVVRNAGPVVPADELRLDNISCPELVVRRLYTFELGSYTVTLGPAEADAVSLAFERYPAEE